MDSSVMMMVMCYLREAPINTFGFRQSLLYLFNKSMTLTFQLPMKQYYFLMGEEVNTPDKFDSSEQMSVVLISSACLGQQLSLNF